ncbi:hypothetical protein [Embleya sp. NPDC001921]
MVEGVVWEEQFVRRLVAARTTKDVARLSEVEIARATGRPTPLLLDNGRLYTLKQLALAAVHWSRLHPDVPVSRIAVTPLKKPEMADAILVAEAHPPTREVRFNRQLLQKNWPSFREIVGAMTRGDARFAAAHSMIHELEHLRHYQHMQPFPLPRSPNTPYSSRDHPEVDLYDYRTDAYDLVNQKTKEANATPAKAAEILGRNAAMDINELVAESGAHIHLYGDQAPVLAETVVSALGPTEKMRNAAPALTHALAMMSEQLDHRTGKLHRASLLSRLREAALAEERAPTNPWVSPTARMEEEGPTEAPDSQAGATRSPTPDAPPPGEPTRTLDDTLRELAEPWGPPTPVPGLTKDEHKTPPAGDGVDHKNGLDPGNPPERVAIVER